MSEPTPGQASPDEVTLTVSRTDLEFVIGWAEGGIAEYSHRNIDQSPVERVREALDLSAPAKEGGQADV